jgi:hypothetical protein
VIGALPPTDVAERNRIILAGPGGKDIAVMPQYYADYAVAAAQLLERAKTIDDLLKSHPDARSAIDAWLHANGREATDVRWVPLAARRATLTMLLDAGTGAPLDALPIDPW